MWRFVALLSFAGCTGLVALPADPPPAQLLAREAETWGRNPGDHTAAAATFLAKTPEPERYWVRFLSFYEIDDDAILARWKRALRAWMHQLVLAVPTGDLRDVPGAGGRLCWFSLKDFDWNPIGWEVNAQLDPVFRQPWVPAPQAEDVRKYIGADPARVKVFRDGTLGVVGVVRGLWWYRQTCDGTRSQWYYDTVYGNQRFGRHHWYEATSSSSAGWYQVSVSDSDRSPKDFVDRNFPRDETDFENVLGAAEGKETKIVDALNLTGTITFGAVDHFGGRTSFVARSNRVVALKPARTFPGSITMATYDVKQSRNQAENGEPDGRDYVADYRNIPAKVQARKLRSDAGELIGFGPNRNLLCLLVNGDRKRVVDAAKRDFVESADEQITCPRYAPGSIDELGPVINPHSCFTCHAPSDGFIPPAARQIQEYLKLGGKVYDDPKTAAKIAAFYSQDLDVGALSATASFRLGIERLTRPYQAARDVLADAAKGELPAANKGWSGAEWVTVLRQMREWYDRPLSLALMARELGVSTEYFRRQICTEPATPEDGADGPAPRIHLHLALQAAAKGVDTPAVHRFGWESGALREAGLIFAAKRDSAKKYAVACNALCPQFWSAVELQFRPDNYRVQLVEEKKRNEKNNSGGAGPRAVGPGQRK